MDVLRLLPQIEINPPEATPEVPSAALVTLDNHRLRQRSIVIRREQSETGLRQADEGIMERQHRQAADEIAQARGG